MSQANGIAHDLLLENPQPLAVLLQIVARKYGVKRSWHRWYAWSRTERDENGEYKYGARTCNGHRVVLESVYISGVVHSTEAAWLRFQAEQNRGRE